MTLCMHDKLSTHVAAVEPKPHGRERNKSATIQMSQFINSLHVVLGWSCANKHFPIKKKKNAK